MTTDTQKRTPEQQAQYDAMVQQFAGDAQRVQGDPGAVPMTSSNAGLDQMANEPMEAHTVVADTAGAAWVWHTKTFKAVPVNLNMLPDQLRKKDEQGRALFTVYGPEDDRSPIKGMYPHVGIHKCLLHPDSAQRTYYNTLGLPVCMKSTIASPFEVTQHMRTTHEQEWKGMEQQRERDERADDRAFQREVLGVATGNAPAAPASEASGDLNVQLSGEAIREMASNPLGEATTYESNAKKQQQVTCTLCPEVFEARSVSAAKSKLRAHMRKEHPDG